MGKAYKSGKAYKGIKLFVKYFLVECIIHLNNGMALENLTNLASFDVQVTFGGLTSSKSIRTNIGVIIKRNVGRESEHQDFGNSCCFIFRANSSCFLVICRRGQFETTL